MLGLFRFISVFLAFTLGMSITGNAASFDCSKATSETEIAICNDPELDSLDELLGVLYQQSLRSDDWNVGFASDDIALKLSQKDWIEKRDETCGSDTQCIREFYLDRSLYLMEYTSRPQWSWDSFEAEYTRLRTCCSRQNKYEEAEVLKLLEFLPFLNVNTDIRHFATTFNLVWNERKVKSVSLLFLSQDNPELIWGHTKGIYNDNPVSLLISVEDRRGEKQTSTAFNMKPLPMETEVSIWDRHFKVYTFFSKGKRSDTYQFTDFTSPPKLLTSQGY